MRAAPSDREKSPRAWVGAASGLVVIAIGLVCLVAPNAPVRALAPLLGLALVVSGLRFAVDGRLRAGPDPQPRWALPVSLALVAAGMVVMSRPAFVLSAFGLVAGLAAVALGALAALACTGGPARPQRLPLLGAIVLLVLGAGLAFAPGADGALVGAVMGACLVLAGVEWVLVAVTPSPHPSPRS